MTTNDNKKRKHSLLNPQKRDESRVLPGSSSLGRLGGAGAYTDIVTTYLNDNYIPFCRQGADKPLFVLFGIGTGSIYCLFDFAEGVVMNWSLLSWAVPEPRKAAITDLLAGINSGLKDGTFYVDKQTGCVAFSRTYMQQPQDTAPNRQLLENFCRDVLEVMPLYHDKIWNVAFGSKNMRYKTEV